MDRPNPANAVVFINETDGDRLLQEELKARKEEDRLTQQNEMKEERNRS